VVATERAWRARRARRLPTALTTAEKAIIIAMGCLMVQVSALWALARVRCSEVVVFLFFNHVSFNHGRGTDERVGPKDRHGQTRRRETRDTKPS
jgi:hypothetical protein